MNITKREEWSSKGVITLFEIKSRGGALVELSSLGAGITRMMVPDREGNLTDIVPGYGSAVDYLYDSPCAGKTPGRFANRIANGRFMIDGKTYHLTKNDGENSLHGGPDGFQNRIWAYDILENGVKFTYMSHDGEEGFPGNLCVTVTYSWNEDNALTIVYDATTDAPTVVNLTNHAYFNLNGVGHGDILGHKLLINGSMRVQSDMSDIPTGCILPVEHTPFDFRSPKEIGRDMTADFENLRYGKGYNHYFFIDGCKGGADLLHAASLYCGETGIRLDVHTTMPGVMLYTGNWLAQAPAGRDGYVYHDYDGVALECHFPPDAPNQPSFPSVVLRPGEKYHHVIRYSFS